MKAFFTLVTGIVFAVIAFGCGGGGGGSGAAGSDSSSSSSSSSSSGNQSSMYEFDPTGYLQYRSFEPPTPGYSVQWIAMTYDGQPIEESMVDEIRILDPSGSEMIPDESGFRALSYMLTDCMPAPCTWSGPISRNGFWASFGTLAAGNYTIEIETDDGQTMTTSFHYPGQLTLPVVAAETMQAEWSGEFLSLRWTLPTGEANWDEVDEVWVVLYDGSGNIVYIDKYMNFVGTDIHESNLNQIIALGDGTLATWQVQTVAYDADMNFASGYSARMPIPNP